MGECVSALNQTTGLDGLRRRWFLLAPNVRGAIWILVHVAVITVMVVFVKLVGRDVPTIELVFFRAAVGLLVILPFVLRAGRAAVATKHLDMHVLRALLTFASMMAFYFTFARLPLADATAMIFTMPLFLIVLAALFLGERVRLRRTMATITGFLGVLIVLRPGAVALDPVMLAALTIGLMDAAVAVVVKKLAGTERPVTIIFYLSVFILAFAAVPTAFYWRNPTWLELGLLASIGALTTFAQVFSILAWRIGETTAVAPFIYAQLILAALVGYFLFAEVPDVWTGAGAAVIAASTFYIMRREAKLKAGGRLAADRRPPVG